MSTFFKGLNDRYAQPGSGVNQPKVPPSRVLVGTVLDVCLNTSSEFYKSPRDLGKIRFRNILTNVKDNEKDTVTFAYPLDRSTTRYPLPGEQVIIFAAFGELSDPENTDTYPVSNIHFYSDVVSTLHNVTYNSYPYVATNRNKVDRDTKQGTDILDQRFDQKLRNYDTFKDGDSFRIYKQLQPYEGDFILQGRFGNTIRLGSTTPFDQNPWSDSGTGGSGIMMLRVDRESTTTENDMIAVENIDTDDSSIYLCTSQRVEMSLSCATSMKTWRTRNGIPSSNGSGGTSTSVLQSQKDVTKTVQKI